MYFSFSILLSPLFSLCLPVFIFVIVRSLHIERLFHVRSYEHWSDLFHNFSEFFGWSPFVSSLYHVSANSTIIFIAVINVGVIDFSFEFHEWCLEGEIVKFERYFKLSSFKWCFSWTLNENFPQSVWLFDYLISSSINIRITLFIIPVVTYLVEHHSFLDSIKLIYNYQQIFFFKPYKIVKYWLSTLDFYKLKEFKNYEKEKSIIYHPINLGRVIIWTVTYIYTEAP